MRHIINRKKVVVGLSGGVDSAVAACLLQEQGYEVMGVTMQLGPEVPQEEAGPEGSPGLTAVEDAEMVAQALHIPYYVMNFRQEFKEKVMDYFAAEYLQGRTPNPCIVCNRYVKWEALLRRSRDIGADYIATGHYARIARLANGRLALRNSVTADKDQTYALYRLTQEQLARTLMPVGEYTKEEIRQIAAARNLPVAGKPDSQEICFIPDDDYAGFVERASQGAVPPPGNFIGRDGEILGRHKGITHYTIGQRKGLGIALGHPVFVSEIRPLTHEVVLGLEEEVFTDRLKCSQLNFMGMDGLREARKVTAKIRYAHRGAACVLEPLSADEILCIFEEPVRAATPGQAVVFYDDGYVLGGGTIM